MEINTIVLVAYLRCINFYILLIYCMIFVKMNHLYGYINSLFYCVEVTTEYLVKFLKPFSLRKLEALI